MGSDMLATQPRDGCGEIGMSNPNQSTGDAPAHTGQAVVVYSARPLFKPPGVYDDAATRQDIVRSLHDALHGVVTRLNQIPVFMRECFEDKVWQQDRVLADGSRLPPMSFHAFVHSPYPRGLETDYATVRRFLGDDAKAIALWDEAVAAEQRHGGDRKSEQATTIKEDIVNLDPKPKKCKITEHSEKVNSEITIGFVKIGDRAGFCETRGSDGSVT